MKIGEKIRRLRMQHNLTQEELADRCELSKGFISQVERELTSPSIATLVDILAALGTNLPDFFNDELPDKIVFTKDDVSVKTNEELNNEIHWIIPNAQKNAIEPIIVHLKPHGKTAFDQPHDGEEFGYVLKGQVQLHFGTKKVRVRSGEAFYFAAQTSHYISNATEKPASVLWVSTPPSF
ncbi:MAG: XRE family transcriptional regulator [Firmicutes bacterium]|nr:XRE family transcriptional regulator [Bacillota bacterium]MDD4263879.1 XRE family transcriptional regulator [Bacillota bacterium]MDD4694735.1 XRE family transcriptional regulator [Bacillota bacterium]